MAICASFALLVTRSGLHTRDWPRPARHMASVHAISAAIVAHKGRELVGGLDDLSPDGDPVCSRPHDGLHAVVREQRERRRHAQADVLRAHVRKVQR
jgi:hypothetical protein